MLLKHPKFPLMKVCQNVQKMKNLTFFEQVLSTQILILAITSVLSISVSILCKFAQLPDVYIFLSPQVEEVHSSSRGYKRCTHLAAHSSKRLNPLSVTILVCIGNTQKRKTGRETASLLVLLV